MKVQKLVPEYIKPPEAARIARDYRNAANEIRKIAARVRQAGNLLGDGWGGKSKENFFSQFGNTPSDLENFASHLDHMASELDAIEVKVEVWKWVENEAPNP